MFSILFIIQIVFIDIYKPVGLSFNPKASPEWGWYMLLTQFFFLTFNYIFFVRLGKKIFDTFQNILRQQKFRLSFGTFFRHSFSLKTTER